MLQHSKNIGQERVVQDAGQREESALEKESPCGTVGAPAVAHCLCTPGRPVGGRLVRGRARFGSRRSGGLKERAGT